MLLNANAEVQNYKETEPKNNNSLIIELRGVRFCDLPGKEFKIAVSRKLNKLQNTDSSTKLGKQFVNKIITLTERHKT